MRLLIASEQPVFCAGLVAVLAQSHDAPAVHICSKLVDIRSCVHNHGPFDLILVDLPVAFGHQIQELLVSLVGNEHGAPVGVLSDRDLPALVRNVMELGASGFIPKSYDGEMMLNAVRLILAGTRFVPESVLSTDSRGFSEGSDVFVVPELSNLTPRQTQVLKLLAVGLSNQKIATQLGISVATVKLHVNAILHALDVPNRTSAALIARDGGIL